MYNNSKNLLFIFFLFLLSFSFHYSLFLKAYSFISSANHLNNGSLYYFITGKDAHYYSSGLMNLINLNYHTPFKNLLNDWFVYSAFVFHKITNFSFIDTIKYFPMFLGSLISPLFYVLSKKLLLLDFNFALKNKNTFKIETMLIFSSIIVGIYPIIIYRTFAGWLDTDIIILPGILIHLIILTNLYFIIKKIKGEKSKNNVFLNLIFLFVVDVFLIKAYFNNSIIIIISLSLFLFYVLFQLYKFYKKYSHKNEIGCGDVYEKRLFLYKEILFIILGFLFYFFHINSKSIIIEFITLFFLLLSFFAPKLKIKNFIILFAILFLFVFLYQNPWLSFFYGRINSYVFTKAENIKYSKSIIFSKSSIDVSELKPIKLYDFIFIIFGVPFFGLIAYLSFVYFFLKKRLSFYIFLPVLLIGSTIFVSGSRFLIYLIFPLLYSFVYLYVYIYIKYGNNNKNNNSKFGLNQRKFLKIIDIVFFTFLYIMFSFFFFANIKITKERGQKILKTKQELNIILDKYYSQKKINLKNEKPKYIFAWWEYGYPISFYTQVITAPNNGNQNPILKYLVALAYNTKNAQQKKCYENVLYLYVNYISSNKIKSEEANRYLIHLLEQAKNKMKPKWCFAKNYPYVFIDYANKEYEKNMKRYLKAFKIQNNK